MDSELDLWAEDFVDRITNGGRVGNNGKDEKLFGSEFDFTTTQKPDRHTLRKTQERNRSSDQGESIPGDRTVPKRIQ